MTSRERFSINLSELDAVITELEKTEGELEALADDVEASIAALHKVWVGLAAEAQKEAQEVWREGMNDMRAALGEMREAARRSHHNYDAGAQANLSMWSGF